MSGKQRNPAGLPIKPALRVKRLNIYVVAQPGLTTYKTGYAGALRVGRGLGVGQASMAPNYLMIFLLLGFNSVAS